VRQAEQIVIQFGGEISVAVGEHDSGVKHLAKSTHIALPHRVNTIPVSLGSRLVRDIPVRIRCSRYALDTLKHVLLADQEARDIYAPISKPGEIWGLVVLIEGQFRKTQESSDCAPALLPRGRDDFGVSVIEEGNTLVREVKPVAYLPARKTELVPEAASKHEPLAHPQGLDLVCDGPPCESQADRLAQLLVVQVAAVPTGHDIRDAGLGSCADEFGLRIAWSGDSHRDYEKLLAFQGGNQRGFIVVIDKRGFHPGRERTGAALASKARYVVPACRHKGLGEVLANLSASLSQLTAELCGGVYADDGHVFDSVRETSGLVLGVLGGHFDELRCCRECSEVDAQRRWLLLTGTVNCSPLSGRMPWTRQVLGGFILLSSV